MNNTNENSRQVWRWRGAEQRQHRRWQCSESTCFTTDRQLYEGIFQNMSTGGVFIMVQGRFQIGQDIIVAGILARDGSEEKRAGRIVRRSRRRVHRAPVSRGWMPPLHATERYPMAGVQNP